MLLAEAISSKHLVEKQQVLGMVGIGDLLLPATWKRMTVSTKHLKLTCIKTIQELL